MEDLEWAESRSSCLILIKDIILRFKCNSDLGCRSLNKRAFITSWYWFIVPSPILSTWQTWKWGIPFSLPQMHGKWAPVRSCMWASRAFSPGRTLRTVLCLKAAGDDWGRAALMDGTAAVDPGWALLWRTEDPVRYAQPGDGSKAALDLRAQPLWLVLKTSQAHGGLGSKTDSTASLGPVWCGDDLDLY